MLHVSIRKRELFYTTVPNCVNRSVQPDNLKKKKMVSTYQLRKLTNKTSYQENESYLTPYCLSQLLSVISRVKHEHLRHTTWTNHNKPMSLSTSTCESKGQSCEADAVGQ